MRHLFDFGYIKAVALIRGRRLQTFSSQMQRLFEYM